MLDMRGGNPGISSLTTHCFITQLKKMFYLYVACISGTPHFLLLQITNSFLSQAAEILGCCYTDLAWVKGKRPQEAESDFLSVVY